MTSTVLDRDERTLVVRIPYNVRKRGGRKLIIVPDGEPVWAPRRPRIDNSIVKALARAFRWRRMLEAGLYNSIKELARAEGITSPYICRILHLTLLSPAIVEAILDGRQPPTMKVSALTRRMPLEWVKQDRWT